MKILCVCLLGLYTAWAYPTGPPETACGDMFPAGHNVTAQNTTAPFDIVLSGTKYGKNSPLTITVRNSSALFFEGLFVQMRDASGSSVTPIGTFTPVSPNLTTLACASSQNSALSHNAAAHYFEKSFTWTAPNVDSGNLKLRMTIVHETPEFWVGVLSDTITYDSTLDVGTTTAGPTGASATVGASLALLLASAFALFV